MPRYEYKLVPAPERATKHRGLKGAASFAATLEEILNEFGREGWHYLRTDTLPQDERTGLTSRTTSYRNLLVFQRELQEAAVKARSEPVPDPTPHAPSPKAVNEPEAAPTPSPQAPQLVADTPEKPTPRFARRPLVADRKTDNGI